MNDTHNFRIAISYSGQKRDFVKQVDQELLKYLDHSEVFYDQRYSALMARPDLDGWLRELFRDQSDLVVVFLSKAHEQSPWCQVESNAVRECFQSNSDAPPPLLFTDGDFDLGMGFSMDHAQSTRDLTPKQVAEMIIKRFKYHYPRVSVKSPGRGRNRFLGELIIVVGLIVGVSYLNQADELKEKLPSQIFGVKFNGGEAAAALTLIVLVLAVMWGMYRARGFIRPAHRRVEYVDPPVSQAADQAPDWESYAHELENHTERERQGVAGRLADMRTRRSILLASIILSIVLVAGHALLWGFLEKSDGPKSSAFLPQHSDPWEFGEIIERHPGHLWLGVFYLAVVFVFCVVVGNRTQKPLATAGFLGAWQPFYLGIIYVLFISTLNYQGLFNTEGGSENFGDEPGNFYVIERIVIIPILCGFTGLIGALIGVAARGKERTRTIKQ